MSRPGAPRFAGDTPLGAAVPVGRMYDDILLPTDGSDAAERAIAVAIAAAEAHDARLHVLYVADTNTPSLSNVQGEVRDVLESRGDEVVESAARRARLAGVETVTEVVQGGPSRTVLSYVDERGVDLVVMGTRGERDVSTLLLGSVTDHVLRDCPVPVVTVPPTASEDVYPPERVLVATDGSDGADAAVDEAARIAVALGAELHVVTVDEAGLLGIDRNDDRPESVVESAAQRARGAGVADPVTAVDSGEVSDALTAYVEDNAVGLVVLGASGRSGLDRRLLGTTAEKVVRTSAVPVVTVPAGSDD